MVIYEYTTNSLHILGALFWLLLMFAFSGGCIVFFPLVCKTLEPVISYITHRCTIRSLVSFKQIYLSITTFLLYGCFITGIVVGITQVADLVSTYHKMNNTQIAHGQLQSIQYELFEYRGEEFGFYVELCIDDQCYQIIEPPGISEESLKALQDCDRITVYYASCRNTNAITKIIAP